MNNTRSNISESIGEVLAQAKSTTFNPESSVESGAVRSKDVQGRVILTTETDPPTQERYANAIGSYTGAIHGFIHIEALRRAEMLAGRLLTDEEVSDQLFQIGWAHGEAEFDALERSEAYCTAQAKALNAYVEERFPDLLDDAQTYLPRTEAVNMIRYKEWCESRLLSWEEAQIVLAETIAHCYWISPNLREKEKQGATIHRTIKYSPFGQVTITTRVEEPGSSETQTQGS